MKVIILTPEKCLFEGEAKSVKVPGASGGFEILDRHAPILSALEEGEIQLTYLQGTKHKFGIINGFVEVLANEVSLLVRV